MVTFMTFFIVLFNPAIINFRTRYTTSFSAVILFWRHIKIKNLFLFCISYLFIKCSAPLQRTTGTWWFVLHISRFSRHWRATKQRRYEYLTKLQSEVIHFIAELGWNKSNLKDGLCYRWYFMWTSFLALDCSVRS